MGPRRPRQIDGELHRLVGDGDARHQRPDGAHVVDVEHRRDLGGLPRRRPSSDLTLLLFARIAHVDLEQEPIELRFRQRIRPLLLDGIARGEHLERIGQGVRRRAHGHLALLHRFEQRGLRLRRRAIHLVRQDQVLEDGPRHEAERSAALRFVQHVRPRDVGGEEVGRELDAAEGEVERARERRHEQRLGQAWDADEEGVTPRRQRDEHGVDHFVLTDDRGGDGLAKLLRGLGGSLEELGFGG